MDTIYITNDPWRAQVAERAGVDRIMVDLEICGKTERQGHLDTVISGHTIADVGRLRSLLNKTLLMVRVNPVHEQTEDEIGACIRAGAEILMLPMFGSTAEVRRFVDGIGGRARSCLLLETGAALARIHDVLEVDGVDEVYIGLNDLHLSLKLDFMFEVLSGGLLEYMTEIMKRRGMKFGFGGVARVRSGSPVSPELILSEHVRLGSSQVILSRDYGKIFDECSRDTCSEVFFGELEKMRACVRRLQAEPPESLLENSLRLKSAVNEIVRAKLAATRRARG